MLGILVALVGFGMAFVTAGGAGAHVTQKSLGDAVVLGVLASVQSATTPLQVASDSARPNFNRPNFNRPNFNRPNFDPPFFNRPNFNRPNFDQPFFNRPNFNRPDVDQPFFVRPFFNPFFRPFLFDEEFVD
jgi:hypothetical protein